MKLDFRKKQSDLKGNGEIKNVQKNEMDGWMIT